jgi:hypothetical protein
MIKLLCFSLLFLVFSLANYSYAVDNPDPKPILGWTLDSTDLSQFYSSPEDLISTCQKRIMTDGWKAAFGKTTPGDPQIVYSSPTNANIYFKGWYTNRGNGLPDIVGSVTYCQAGVVQRRCQTDYATNQEFSYDQTFENSKYQDGWGYGFKKDATHTQDPPNSFNTCVDNCQFVVNKANSTRPTTCFDDKTNADPAVKNCYWFYSKQKFTGNTCTNSSDSFLKLKDDALVKAPVKPKIPQSQLDCAAGQHFGYVNNDPVCLGSTETAPTPTANNKNADGTCNSKSSGKNSGYDLVCTQRCQDGNYTISNGLEGCTGGALGTTGVDGKPSPTPFNSSVPAVDASGVAAIDGAVASGTATASTPATGGGSSGDGSTSGGSTTTGTASGVSGSSTASGVEETFDCGSDCEFAADSTYSVSQQQEGISSNFLSLNTKFTSIKNFTPVIVGVCPRPEFEAFGKHFVIDSHCKLADDYFTIFSSIMIVIYTICALFIVLKA